MYLTSLKSTWLFTSSSFGQLPSTVFFLVTSVWHFIKFVWIFFSIPPLNNIQKPFSLISLHNIAYHIIAILLFLYFVSSKICLWKSCIKFINQTHWCNNEHRIGFIKNCALLHDFSLVHMRYASGERILSIDQSAPQDNGVNWMRVPFGEKFSSCSQTTPEFFFLLSSKPQSNLDDRRTLCAFNCHGK